MANNDWVYDKDSTLVDISPCLGICTYNEEDYCIGCKRHMTEIFDWYDYPEEMQKAIIKDLEERRVNV